MALRSHEEDLCPVAMGDEVWLLTLRGSAAEVITGWFQVAELPGKIPGVNLPTDVVF